MTKYLIVLFLVWNSAAALVAQNLDTSAWDKFADGYKIKASIALQLWATYTTGQEIYNTDKGVYTPVDNRFNTQLRRTRLSVVGQPYSNLSFNLTGALDFVGKDVLSATQGGLNNGSSPLFRVWNAYVDWKVNTRSDLLHVVVGYLPPQIGRESMTGALRSTSFEKSWSQNYLRRSIVGLGPGRAMGVNFGGQYLKEKSIGLSYDLGIFSTEEFAYNGNSSGINYAPLIVGRIAFYFGDAESPRYTIGHKVNYFGSRRGLTMAIAGAYQSETDLFLENKAIGIDWLYNAGNLNIDGDLTFFKRTGIDDNRVFSISTNTGYIRLGYNIHLRGAAFIEPIIMYTIFNGPLDVAAQRDAAIVKGFAGEDRIIELGANYHLNPNLKLSLFYTLNSGDQGAAEDGAAFNNYFAQSGAGAIRRGNLIGLGIVGIF
jgi:hypothetical protein